MSKNECSLFRLIVNSFNTSLIRSLTSLFLVISLLWNGTQIASAEPPVLDAKSKKLIEKVMVEYENGNYDGAVQLLTNDLKENPNSGLTHYYLGMVQKKMGYDAIALNELEWAARMCPPEVISSLTKQAVSSTNGGTTLPKVPVIVQPKSDWFSMIGTSVGELFGGKKPEAKISETGAIELPTPDLSSAFDDMYNEGRKLIKGIGKPKQEEAQMGYQSWDANIMPMHDMQALVDKSRLINSDEWASHADGVQHFPNGYGGLEWDRWVNRYKRAFQHILMGLLASDANSGQVRGMAACIFSLDKKGNLRGHIYASTGDNVLNTALLKTIRLLNHSRILSFPYDAKQAGINFRMTWNFGRILAYIRAYREYKTAVELKAKEEMELQAKLLEQKKATEAKATAAKLKADADRKAKAQLLNAPKIKTKVLGEVLTPMRPKELQAVAQSLGDKRITQKGGTVDSDIFSNISDSEIMSWPDISF